MLLFLVASACPCVPMLALMVAHDVAFFWLQLLSLTLAPMLALMAVHDFTYLWLPMLSPMLLPMLALAVAHENAYLWLPMLAHVLAPMLALMVAHHVARSACIDVRMCTYGHVVDVLGCVCIMRIRIQFLNGSTSFKCSCHRRSLRICTGDVHHKAYVRGWVACIYCTHLL